MSLSNSNAGRNTHHLAATPETCHWGYFDGGLKPVLKVKSGDRVTIECLSGNPEHLPPAGSGMTVLPDHREVIGKLAKGTGNHILTGPVYVEEAEPGDVLEVRIIDIELRQDWGWNVFRPYMGTLPEDFPYQKVLHVPLDRQANLATMPWGHKIALRPFFGPLALAPKKEFGKQNSKEPREWGGNLDCKDLVAGSTVYLPVQNKGGLFSTGDGHAIQGHGEVNGTAIETALTGTFDFIVRKDLTFKLPRAETPTHYITFGLDADLDDAAKQALREMVGHLTQQLGISPDHAYAFCSFVVDLHVTQTVNGVKGVHAMVEKKHLAKP
jgi:acetamidase/formamidase